MAAVAIKDRVMLIDDEDLCLLNGKTLRLHRSRNNIYAAFGKNGAVHRLVMHMVDPSLVVDHINGDGLDNRKINLRAVSASTNVKNRRVSRSKTNGMPPGMWRYRDRIAVQITNNGKKQFVGYFKDQETAHAALNEARQKIGRPPV